MYENNNKCIIVITVDNIDEERLGIAGNYKNLIIQKKNIACNKLFEDGIHDEPAPHFQIEPLEYIPEYLLDDFTYGNRILVKRYFLKDSFPSNRDSGNFFLLFNRFYAKISYFGT